MKAEGWRDMETAPRDGSLVEGMVPNRDPKVQRMRFSEGLWLSEDNEMLQPVFWRACSDRDEDV
jgi:hypothetical protein